MKRPPPADLRFLIDKMLDQGVLNNQESVRLIALLKEPKALRYYAEIMFQESIMADALNGLVAKKIKPRFSARNVVLGFFAAAACVMIALWTFNFVGNSEGALQSGLAKFDVRVTGLQGVEWGVVESIVRPDGSLADAHVVMRSGLLELTYPSGVRVTLQGPTDFRVRDMNSGALTKGRLVAYVPPQARGFTIDYGAGEVIDLGTEFGLGVNERKIDLSVFDGTVVIRLPDGTTHKISGGRSLAYDGLANITTKEQPLTNHAFVRSLPKNDFAWEIDLANPGSLEFDVTSLISRPEKYLAAFKWIDGSKDMYFSDVELKLNGETISKNPHQSISGSSDGRYGTLAVMDLNQERFSQGRWTLHARATSTSPLVNTPSMIRGVLLFENEFAANATPEDYIGRWKYKYRGDSYIREFHKEGRVSLHVNGLERGHEYFTDSRWVLENSIMKVYLPKFKVNEYHILRDPKTMIFMNRPYENAVKIEDD